LIDDALNQSNAAKNNSQNEKPKNRQSSNINNERNTQSAKEAMNASEKRLMEEKIDSIVAHFFLSVIWSIGAVLKHASREKFNSFFNDLCDNSIGKYPK
jgi:hypothetical protein